MKPNVVGMRGFILSGDIAVFRVLSAIISLNLHKCEKLTGM